MDISKCGCHPLYARAGELAGLHVATKLLAFLAHVFYTEHKLGQVFLRMTPHLDWISDSKQWNECGKDVF